MPADRYWGACTQRALKAAPAFGDRIPDKFYRCYGYAKHAAAVANALSGLLPPWKREAISIAATELIEGKLTGHFPLGVAQSGSGLETDCNVNEVLANRSIQLLGGIVGSWLASSPAKGREPGAVCHRQLRDRDAHRDHHGDRGMPGSKSSSARQRDRTQCSGRQS